MQGVGFRYTARELARHYPVSGFVRNLDDGRVELVIEGARSEIDQLIASIRERMTDFIRAFEQHVSAATGEFAGFTIRQ